MAISEDFALLRSFLDIGGTFSDERRAVEALERIKTEFVKASETVKRVADCLKRNGDCHIIKVLDIEGALASAGPVI